ncbi:MAG: hypothetical protein GTO13_22495 [Proteobacteria bacterium]|nr:hypothetical protein [Pseudomonadota bacterium]NIS63354.1 hypothetical protein [Pseudomonadota bacterium]
MSESTVRNLTDRRSEWFVPKFGPLKLRFFLGLLFLPYTGMVLSFAVIGSMVAERIHWDRVGAIVLIYFLGLGIGAHALDALGSKEAKPWGEAFQRRQLWLIASISLAAAYLIAIYYMILYVPWLWVVALLEGFFVFAYNLEWFGGKFHTDNWFAFSWGFLPVLAGYLIQTNRISPEALLLGLSMTLFSLIEIKSSRPYKDLKRHSLDLSNEQRIQMEKYEVILKSVSLGIILLGVGLVVWRLFS